MYLRIRSLFMGWKDHRRSLLRWVMPALLVLLIFTSTFPIGSISFEAEEAGDNAPFVLTAATAASAIHLPALASRQGRRAHERVHLRTRRGRRNSADRGFDPAQEIIVPLIVFLHLIAGLLPASRRRVASRAAEYLRSHIGEKRFADGMSISPIALFLRVLSVTVLSAAPSLFYSCRSSFGWLHT